MSNSGRVLFERESSGQFTGLKVLDAFTTPERRGRELFVVAGRDAQALGRPDVEQLVRALQNWLAQTASNAP